MRHGSQMRRPENIFKRAAGIATHGALAKRRRRHPDPPPYQLDGFKVGDPRPLSTPPTPPAGVKKFGIWETGREEKAKVGRNERHVVANPISGGSGDDDRRGFRGALHLKSQARAKQAAALITWQKCYCNVLSS